MKRIFHSPLSRSFVIHSALIASVVLVMNGDSPQSINVPITLERVSISDRMKKVFHRAVHTIGIPHVEPQESSEGSENLNAENVQSSSSEESAGGGIAPTEMQKYLSNVVAGINRVKKYPREAQFNEQEGVVTVLIEIGPDGKILRTQLEKSTVFESLNAAAMAAIQKLGNLPPLPLQPSGNPVSRPIQLHVPIHFQLK